MVSLAKTGKMSLGLEIFCPSGHGLGLELLHRS